MDTVSIDCPTLYSQLGSPRYPLVLDVRPKGMDALERLIAGALRPEGEFVAFAN